MSAKRLWGGRFKGKLDPRIDVLNRSIGFDCRLILEDIEGSTAWAHALHRAGILDAKEHRQVVKALAQVESEWTKANGAVEYLPADEDIHTYVERRVTEIAGAAGEKLHTGRSRNDQVATDFHLWLKTATDNANNCLQVLAQELVALAKRAGDIAIPAYTHLQRAQPVLVAHHLLAYAEMLWRDHERFQQAYDRADVMPLGCAAAVGTGFNIDRRALAKDLDFKRIAANSLDAVGSRDAALEFLSACTILSVHLSRLGEELVNWSSSEFGFIKLSDTVATGSSLLPQKRNPDAAELARGKAGRVLGHFVGLATTIKGLPLAYNKDLQEDKEACFDAFDTIDGVCFALLATLEGIEFVPERCAAALTGGHILATELADYLVRGGTPFRRAHHIVGEVVQRAEMEGVDIAELDLTEFGPDVKKALTIKAALAAKRAIGGTAPSRVRQALKAWDRRWLKW